MLMRRGVQRVWPCDFLVNHLQFGQAANRNAFGTMESIKPAELRKHLPSSSESYAVTIHA